MPKSDRQLDPGYAPVADRIALFYERHPEGRIVTDLVSRDGGVIVFRARVYRGATDERVAATGWASEREGDGDINTVACLENTETSAIGRALANLGFLASGKRPSAEEMAKAARARGAAAQRQSRESPSVPVVRIAEPVSSSYEARHRNGAASEQHGDSNAALSDVLSLLAAAELAGLDAERTSSLRERLGSGRANARQLERADRWLRRWLDDRDVH
jgi:hypothetical protein